MFSISWMCLFLKKIFLSKDRRTRVYTTSQMWHLVRILNIIGWVKIYHMDDHWFFIIIIPKYSTNRKKEIVHIIDWISKISVVVRKNLFFMRKKKVDAKYLNRVCVFGFKNNFKKILNFEKLGVSVFSRRTGNKFPIVTHRTMFQFESHTLNLSKSCNVM